MDQIYLKTNSSKMKLASYISVSTLLENVISSPLPSVSDPTVPAPGTPLPSLCTLAVTLVQAQLLPV